MDSEVHSLTHARTDVDSLAELLRENLRVSEDNNRILHRMQFWGRVAFWAKSLLWITILVLPFLLYSYIAPLINILPGGAGKTSGTSTSLFGFPSPAEFTKVLHPVSTKP